MAEQRDLPPDESTRVQCAISNGVADVRLCRPKKMNAVDSPMLSALRDAAVQLRATEGLRVVVLSGEGRAFCAGLDLDVLRAMSSGTKSGWAAAPLGEEEDGPNLSPAQRVVWEWATMPVPVIAAIHGAALGAGLQIGLAADLRVVAPGAKLGLLEVRWGVVPDMLATFLLPSLIGPDRALELTLMSDTISGEQAVEMGLATRLSTDPRETALELAHHIAQRSPHAVRAAKALLNRRGPTTLRESAGSEQAAMAALMGSGNQIEAIRATAERRQPQFADV